MVNLEIQIDGNIRNIALHRLAQDSNYIQLVFRFTDGTEQKFILDNEELEWLEREIAQFREKEKEG